MSTKKIDPKNPGKTDKKTAESRETSRKAARKTSAYKAGGH
jgi:hypothetical protein